MDGELYKPANCLDVSRHFYLLISIFSLPRSLRFPLLFLHFDSSPKHPMISLLCNPKILFICIPYLYTEKPLSLKGAQVLTLDGFNTWTWELRLSWGGPRRVLAGCPILWVLNLCFFLLLCLSPPLGWWFLLWAWENLRAGYYLQTPLHPPCISVLCCGYADNVSSPNLTFISKSLSLLLFYGPFLTF